MFGLCSFSFNNYYIVAISWRTPFYGRYHELVGRYEMSIFQMAIDLFPLTFLYRRQDFYRTWLWVARVSKYERGTIYTSRAHEFIPNFVMGPLGCSSFLLVFFSYDFSFLCFFSAVSCVQCCLCHWIVHSWLTLWISLTFA
jgi:hypothetical protein